MIAAAESRASRAQTFKWPASASAPAVNERIAGQKRRHHQARLAEDHREEDQVGPGAVVGDHRAQRLVQVEEIWFDEAMKERS